MDTPPELLADGQTVITNDAGTFRITLHNDDSAESPRTWSNLGVLTVSPTGNRFVRMSEDPDDHREMQICRATDDDGSPVALSRWLRAFHGATAVVVVARDYDGNLVPVEETTDRRARFHGAIYDTPETRAECGTPADMRAALLAELDVYNKWQSGEFVGRVIERFIPACEHGHGDEWVNTGDDVWGFDDRDAALEDGRDNVAGYGQASA